MNSSAHILVIDDNQASRRATRGMFELLGYQVGDCASGEAALEALSQDPTISLCILDQKLSSPGTPGPRLDGIETLREMRRKHPQVLVIMFTAAEDRGEEAIAAGATFYYYKPRLDPAHLATLVDALVKMQKLERTNEQAQKRIRYLNALSRIDNELVTAGRAQNVFDSVAKELTNALGAHSAWLLLREPGARTLRTTSFAGYIDRTWLSEGPRSDIGIISRCLNTGERQFVKDAARDKEFQSLVTDIEHPSFRRYLGTVTAAIAVPVLQGTTRLGLCVLFFRGSPTFTHDEEEFVSNVATRVAIALARIEDQHRIEAVAIERAKLSDLGLLGAGVAHALKNPLADALAALACLRDETIPSPAGFQKLEQAEQAIAEAARLVRNLSIWARPQGAEPVELDLKQVFTELRAIMGERTEQQHIELHVNIPPNSQYVWGPPDALKMAFVDLLANAVKAMEQGGVLTVSARKDPTNRFVVLAIEDTGPGLPDELKRLFFDEENGPGVVPAGGIGLGLYLAKKVIASAGGALEYEKRRNGGSRFTIRLPRNK